MDKTMTSSFLKGAKKVDVSQDFKDNEKPNFLKGSRKVETQNKEKKEPENNEFYDFLFSKEPNAFEEGLATTVRGVGSAAIGLPGNIKKLTDKAGKSIFDFVSPMLGLNDIELPEDYNIIPATSDIENAFDMATEGKYIPTEEQRPYYEAAQDMTSMFMPGSGAFKLWQKIGIPIAGQLTKEGIKSVGGSESAQEFGKLGMLLGLSVASLANGEKYASNLMSQAESLMPQGQMINAAPIESALNRIKAQPWYKGADIPSKRPAKQLLDAIEKNISNGQMDGKMAIQLRKEANELQKNLGAFDIFRKDDKRKAIALLNEAKDSVMKGLENYGTTVDPLFWKSTQEANKAYAVLSRSKVISNFIEKHAPILKSEGAKNLFKVGLAGGELALGKISPALALGTASGAAGAVGLIKTTQIMYRIMNDSKLRKYYFNVLDNAAKSNSKAMAQNLQKLDEELLDEEL